MRYFVMGIILIWISITNVHGNVTETLFVKTGSTAIFVCPYTSKSNPLIWRGPPNYTKYSIDSKVNELISSFDRVSLSENLGTGEYNLTIKNFSRQDAGNYRCDTVLRQQSQEHEIVAVLTEPPTNIRIVNESVSGIIYGTENMPVTVLCSVDSGIPSNTSMFLSISGKLTVANNNSNLISFSFNTLRQDHMKIIKCVADNLFYKVEKKIQLFVYLFPVVYTTAIPHSEIDEGTNLTIICTNETNTGPTELMWLFNGVTIIGLNDSVLLVHNASRQNSGHYTCQVQNRVGIGTSTIRVQIKYKPYAVEYTKRYLVEAKQRKPTFVSFMIGSDTKPYVSWIKTLGGKLGYWNVYGENENIFNISSNILINSKDQIGTYIFRVRNSVGSIDVEVELVSNIVSAIPAFVTCNVSTHVNLSCSITTGDYISSLKNSWVQINNGNIIRKLQGAVLNTTSVLTINYCDYRDSGVYMCEWMVDDQIYSASVVITVYSNPIYADQRNHQNNGILTLDLMFFSCPKPFEVVWFYNDRPIGMESLIMSNLKQTKVEMNFYNKRVETDGYIASAIINNSHYASVELYSSQVRNLFGNMDTSFRTEVIDYTFYENSYSSNTMFDWTTIFVDDPTQKSLYFVLIGTGITVFLLLNTIVLAVVLRRKSLKDKLRITPKDNIQRDQLSVNSSHLSNNPSYEEIASVSYQDVIWRNYAIATDSSEEDTCPKENDVNDNSSIENRDRERKQTNKHKYEIHNKQTPSIPQNTYIEII